MKIAPYLAKKKLDAAVSEVSCISWLFANDPMSDFSRNRKLSVESLFRLMLKFSGKSLQSEISSYQRLPYFSTAARSHAPFSFSANRGLAYFSRAPRIPLLWFFFTELKAKKEEV